MKVRWLCLLLVAVICASAHGQTNTDDPFAGVPTTLRASLRERLKLLVQYQRSQQWEKHYDLLFFTFTQGMTKEEYAKRSRHWYTEVVPEDLILDFVPRATIIHEASADARWWTIEGCAKFRKKGRIENLYASVDAHRYRGNWYFSDVGAISPIDGPPQRCPYSGDSAHLSLCSAKGIKKTKASRREN